MSVMDRPNPLTWWNYDSTRWMLLDEWEAGNWDHLGNTRVEHVDPPRPLREWDTAWNWVSSTWPGWPACKARP